MSFTQRFDKKSIVFAIDFLFLILNTAGIFTCTVKTRKEISLRLLTVAAQLW